MDYKNGKIYTIRSYQTDKFYIGSTCSTLTKRLYQHKSRYKYGTSTSTSREIVKYNDCYIELLEAFECKNKNELRQREGELIRKYKNDIVNCRIENRTTKEWQNDNKEKIKQWRTNNKEKLKQYHKQYKIDNKEKCKYYYEKYHIDNKEKIKQYGTQYRIDNEEKRKQKYICDCGRTYSYYHLSIHKKTKYHINYMNNPFINFKL